MRLCVREKAEKVRVYRLRHAFVYLCVCEALVVYTRNSLPPAEHGPSDKLVGTRRSLPNLLPHSAG